MIGTEQNDVKNVAFNVPWGPNPLVVFIKILLKINMYTL